MDIEDLIGKFVVIYLTGGSVKYPTVMRVNQVEDIAGRLFLIGSQPKRLMEIRNWLGEVETHIAWETVAQFHVFNDYKAYKKAVSNNTGDGFFNRFKK